jgi:DNA-binding response OmpR family regulator
MQAIQLLWVDDEIDLLKPHILFLQQKGYEVASLTNGYDALDYLQENPIDLVILDESMPGMTGLETLVKIKELFPYMPIVMATKNEAEYVMEDAIGNQISDYLIKPIHPNQVLISIKKIIDGKRLIAEKTNANYQQEFTKLFMALQANPNHMEWMELYKKLVFWELELSKSNSTEMMEILHQQKAEANKDFFKFIQKNYCKWIASTTERPLLSPQVLAEKVFPQCNNHQPTFLLVIDNLRYDQWKVIEPFLLDDFKINEEDLFFSILPTATQYARNALFAGLTPFEIAKQFPDKWRNDDDDDGKNKFELEFLQSNLKRNKLDHWKVDYVKITNNEHAKLLEDQIHNYLSNDLTVIVYNFVDMLSHARTEMDMIKELAPDESAYRSLTYSWFEHSPLLEIIKKIAQKNARLVITTDHGTIRVKTPSKVIGDRSVNSNLRYKQGKNLNYVAKDVFEIKNPADAFLPKVNMSQTYIFAKNDTYFVYQNNYNHFANFFANSFQHGGISLEEMLIPYASYTSKI